MITLGRTWLLGGASSVHDPLIAAALRASGVATAVIPAADRAALERGRALLSRGYPSSVAQLVGATVRELERRGAEGLGVLTLSGTHSHWASDYRRALDAAGFAEVAVRAVPIGELFLGDVSPRTSELGLGRAAPSRLARAIVAGDLLLAARASASDPASAWPQILRTRAAIAEALLARKPLCPPLVALRHTLAALSPTRGPARARVRLTGDPISAITDGSGGQGLLDQLEARGAAIVPQSLAEWLLFLAWQEAAPTRTAGLERAIRRAQGAYAHALGLTDVTSPDFDRLAALSAPCYPLTLRGGSGGLEVATFLAVERDHSADLVVSIKPFASTTSSSISDAILQGLARRSSVGFLSVEVTGDADAQLESRLELALDLAARRGERGSARR